jgi:hypothetical protein
MKRREIENLVNDAVVAFRDSKKNEYGTEWACSSGMLEATVANLLNAMIEYQEEKDKYSFADDMFDHTIKHTLARFEELKSLSPAE